MRGSSNMMTHSDFDADESSIIEVADRIFADVQPNGTATDMRECFEARE